MLLILSLGLFPLGLIAILASVQSARQNRTDRGMEVRTQVELGAQRLNSAIARGSLTIRAASAAIAATGQDSPVCERTLARLADSQMVQGSFALYGDGGRLRCSTPGITAPARLLKGPPNGYRVGLSDEGALDFLLFGPDGTVEAAGEFPRQAVASVTRLSPENRDYRIEIIDRGRSVVLHDEHGSGALKSTIVRTSPVAGGQLTLRMTAGMMPITATEFLLILLPVVMWFSAAFIGWLIVNRLLLQPLGHMQRVVSGYRPGERRLDITNLPSPAREIGELGQAFHDVTLTVARHEAELEAAVERQTRLVREVHHRVKNNLQVVASLLNLHSRGSRNEDVAAAYASIQRRVDALAVVHRNHYAELEENRGVGLKPLISELGFNLRATAPRSAAGMSISLDIEPYSITQDVAVSVAFLITEIVEFAMFCGANAVRISVTEAGPATALLTVESDGLRTGAPCDPDLQERFDRIITGLARQLRSTLERDGATGSYSLNISVLDHGLA
jgi:two-component sensor histidine kinase